MYILHYLKVRRGYWKLKQKALVCTLGSTFFGNVYGRVVRQTRQLLIIYFYLYA
jgi:hypothetical protein